MERIKLTREEKKLFLNFSRRNISIPDGMTEEQFNYAVVQLSKKNLISIEMGVKGLKAASLTHEGKAYLAVNPSLRNPFPWDITMKAATLIAAVAATTALFIGCCRLLMLR